VLRLSLIAALFTLALAGCSDCSGSISCELYANASLREYAEKHCKPMTDDLAQQICYANVIAAEHSEELR
jgi:hypothetical protein